MTRKLLANMEGDRRTFTGRFERYGKKQNYRGPETPTILLVDVTDTKTGQIVTEHLWFNLTKGFNAIRPLEKGDMIQFDARVKDYVKGYVNWRKGVDDRVVDWKLSHPTKIKKL